MEHLGDHSTALSFYKAGQDFLSMIKLYCSLLQFDKVCFTLIYVTLSLWLWGFLLPSNWHGGIFYIPLPGTEFIFSYLLFGTDFFLW